MNVDEAVPDADLAWERELVATMPQECVGKNIALVSVTKLLVYGGTIYQNYIETKIGVLGQERCLSRN